MEDPEGLWQLKSTEVAGGPGGGALWCSLARVTGVGVGGGGDSALCGGGGGIRRLSETNFESGNGGPLPLTQQLNCCLLFFTFLTLSFSHFSFQQCRQLLLLLLSRIRFCVCFCAILCASVCVCTCLPRICTAHTECPQSATVTALHNTHCALHKLCTQTQRVSHDKGRTTLLIRSIQTTAREQTREQD